MPIPDYQSIMLPLLKQISDGQAHKFSEVKENLAQEFKLTPQERRELLPRGRQALFDNRVGWARTYLKKANLLHYPQRGELKINERGQRVLKEKPEKINIKYLKQFGEFMDFITCYKYKNFWLFNIRPPYFIILTCGCQDELLNVLYCPFKFAFIYFSTRCKFID